MQFIKRIYDSFRRKDEGQEMYTKKAFKSNRPVRKNIYGNKTLGESLRRDHKIHFVFKYKFFIPLLILGKKLLGKFLIKEMPDEPHNKNFLIFNKSIDEALKIWIEEFYAWQCCEEGSSQKKKFSQEELDKRLNGPSCEHVKTMKKLILTMSYNDTSYRALFDIVMHQIGKNMMDEYKGRTVDHVFYSSRDIYDARYFMVHEMMNKLVIEQKMRMRQGVVPNGKK